ncbi:MAG: tetratricopeptide repeat protein [Crocinitomicaceae bacterium]|nr:tetratricopeptide repeat protein [Crocinitomicaceae bacterium]
MFDSEEDDFFDANLNEDIANFENYLKGGAMGFVDSDRLEFLIDHYLMNSQYSKANQAADYARDQFPYYSVFTIRKAQAMSAIGQLKEALNLLNAVEKMEFGSAELMLTKASIFSQLRDHKQAIKYFNEALRLVEGEEDRDEIYLDLAMEYQALRDFNGALKVLEEAIKINPSNEGAIYEIAYCYDQLGNFEQAIKCYSDFIDENPYSFTAWYNLGNAYSKLEDYEKAIDAYGYCIVINEDFGPVYFNLGNAYMGQDDFQQAIDAFQKCMDLDGEDPMAFCYMGECFEQLGDLDSAEFYYRRSLDLAPLLPDAWLGLGIVEDLKGNTREGITLITKASELDPDNSGIFHVLAGAYEKVEQIEEAAYYFDKSLKLDSTDEDCLRGFVQLLSKVEPDTEILSFLQNFQAEYGANDSIDLLIVNQLWKLGRKEEAVSLFRLCVEKNLEYAKEIFEINSDLRQVSEFIHLTEQ